MKTLVKRWVAVTVSLLMVLGCCLATISYANVSANAANGIMNNGLNGIEININEHPYSDYYASRTTVEYTSMGCTWFVMSRATQKTGTYYDAVWSAEHWIDTVAPANGYTVELAENGNMTISPDSVLCYYDGFGSRHVAYVERVDGNTVTISEGGSYRSDEAHGYCIIREVSLSEIGWTYSNYPNTMPLQGVVHLTSGGGTPVDPPTPSLTTSWDNYSSFDGLNANFYATISASINVNFTEAGMTVWQDGVQVGQISESTSVSDGYMNMWYSPQELGMALSAGHTYTYQFYAVANGQRYESEVYSYTTPAPEPVQQQNQWTQELSMEGWTYGESANAPTASAQYGEVVFTYSDAEDGIYSAEIPTNAGIYYVKAEVAETSEYTGLTAITSFTIDRAISELPDVGELNAIYGQQLSDIALPDGMTWSENQGKEFDGTVGDCQTGKLFYADYTPADTKNYVGLRGQPIPVNVLPRDISDLELPQITADTNLEELSLSLDGLELVLDRDYTVSQQTKEETGEVIVTIEGTGNYTGMVSTSYTLPEEPVNPSEEGSDPSVTPDHNDGNSNSTSTGAAGGNSATNDTEAESDVPQTGDNTVFSITAIAAVMLLSGCGIVIAVKQRKKSR